MLTIRVVCIDPEPDRIAVHTMQRDGDMAGDDIVTIVLDTFDDGRTGYYFRINAAGAKLDGLISARFVTSTDWDGSPAACRMTWTNICGSARS